MADRKFAAFKANVTELLRRKKWDVFLFDKLLRPTYAGQCQTGGFPSLAR